MSVLAVGPFLKGLFFWTPLLGAIMALAIAFAIWNAAYRRDPAPRDWAGISLISLIAIYCLQFVWAVYPRGNLDVLLRVIAAYFIYVMVSSESTASLRRVFSWAILLIALAAGAVGYVQYLGGLNKLPESFVEILPWVQMPGGTVIGSFEYHNATAVLVLCGFILAAGLACDNTRPLPSALLGGAATLLSLVFFFCQSRGAFVVMPFAILALLAGLDSERRWMGLTITATSVLPAVATIKIIGDAISAHAPMAAASWTVLACLAGCVGGLFIGLPLKLAPRVRSRILLVCLLVAAIAVGALVSSGRLADLLPKQADRYSQIDAEGASSRFRYYADALKVISSSPWGLGGWGWARVYHSIQAEDYFGREVHSHYLQVAVEAGIPGLVAFLAALAILTVRAWKHRRSEGSGWPLAAAGLALAAHSAIDFDLSYGVLWFLLWTLFAASAPSEDHEEDSYEWVLDDSVPPPRLRLPEKWAVLGVVAIVIALLAGRLYLASRLVDSTAKHELGKDKISIAEDAVHYDPWNTDALLTLGTREGVDRAVALDPMNPEPHWQLALRLEREHDYTGALASARTALALYPWVPDYCSKVADLEGSLMLDSLVAGDVDDATSRAGRILELQAEVAKRTLVSNRLKAWPADKVSRALFNLRYGQALFLNVGDADAVKALQEATKSPLIGHEANLWLYAIYERANDSKSMAALQDEPAVRFRALNPVYKAIRTW